MSEIKNEVNEMKTVMISFSYNNRKYYFEEEIESTPTNVKNFILKCYKEIGAPRKKVHNCKITFSHWNFWAGYVV
jgi:hypothetical protein